MVADGNQYDCVDGRQRLAAIFSFVGLNKSDVRDKSFQLSPSNEVKDDPRLKDLIGVRYGETAFKKYEKQFLGYTVRVVQIGEVEDETDLNLQFQRLQIAQILNAAEKLNAMVGEMRDRIFGKDGFGTHSYFVQVGMRNERFGTKQSASQVAINAVSYNSGQGFCRARFLDMQEFFKNNFKIKPPARDALSELQKRTDEILQLIKPDTLKRIRNRAMVVSVLLFYFIESKGKQFTSKDWNSFDRFLHKVIDELARVAKIRLVDDSVPWERLQLAITQASVEKSAIEIRHEIFAQQFRTFLGK